MTRQTLLLAGAALLFTGAAQADATEAQAAQARPAIAQQEAPAPSASSAAADSAGTTAAKDSAQANLEKWQLRRLNEPTERELTHEREGNVYIYDGLTAREVDQALSAHFDRIEYMMFLGTRKTVPAETENSNADGDVETESPGCL